MNNIERWSGLQGGHCSLCDDIVCHDVAGNDVKFCVFCRVHKVQNACFIAKHDASTCCGRINPPFQGLIYASRDNRRSQNCNWEISAPFFQSALSERLAEGVSVRVISKNSLLLFLHFLRSKCLNFGHKLLWVLTIWQVVNFLSHGCPAW